MNPLVSVIVPVFNCEPYLAEALESIFAQDYRPLEVIVVDDGSTDRSAAIAQTFPEVRLIRQPNAGVGSARNVGLAAAHGEMIAWLDGDDFWWPGKLSLEVKFLAANEKSAMTLCHQRMFVTPGDPVPSWIQSPKAEKWLTHSLPAMMIRRSTFDVVGNFATRFPRIGEDFDWLMRAREKGLTWDVLDDVLVSHRVRPGSLTADPRQSHRDFISVARLAMERRRAKAGTGS